MTAGFDLAEQVEGGNGGGLCLSVLWASSGGCSGQEWMKSILRGVGDLSCASPRNLWLSQATAAVCPLGG